MVKKEKKGVSDTSSMYVCSFFVTRNFGAGRPKCMTEVAVHGKGMVGSKQRQSTLTGRGAFCKSVRDTEKSLRSDTPHLERECGRSTTVMETPEPSRKRNRQRKNRSTSHQTVNCNCKSKQRSCHHSPFPIRGKKGEKKPCPSSGDEASEISSPKKKLCFQFNFRRFSARVAFCLRIEFTF